MREFVLARVPAAEAVMVSAESLEQSGG
jgi:hypothetical protein